MWEISNLSQISSFLKSLFLGGIFCIFFDVFRSFRKVFDFSDMAVFAQDLLCFAVFAPITFCFLLATTNGEPRFYIYVGMAIGFLVLRKAVSPCFLMILSFVLSLIKTAAVCLCGLLCRLRDFFLRFFQSMSKFFEKNCKKALNIAKKLLKKR